MGSGARNAVRRRSPPLTRTAQVVPDLATFAVDDGFSYAVPDALTGVRVGSIVRVPLGGRRVRGYVVNIRPGDSITRDLREIVGVSGDLPAFDPEHLETLRWAAMHYVAPVAAMLPRATPPNLPRVSKSSTQTGGFEDIAPTGASPLPAATAAAGDGLRTTAQYLVVSEASAEGLAGLAGAAVAGGRSVLIIAPTIIEAQALARGLRAYFSERVSIATSALPAKVVTAAWVRARTQPGTVTVGTREAAFWPIAKLAMTVVVEEGRRGMKAPQTPTTHVREIMKRRAAVERFQLIFTGPVPTSEAVAAGTEINEAAGRVWPLVEIVDRSEDPPGSGLVGERVRRAVSIAANEGRRCFVLVHRRGYAPAFRCVRCRTIRRCPECGSAADRGDVCRRCGSQLGVCVECGASRFEPLGAGVGRIVDDLKRLVRDLVGTIDDPTMAIQVGTERDLPRIAPVDLAAAIDIDGVMLAPHYRAAEDAVRLVARLAGKVRKGRGNRCMVQTGMPDHSAIAAMRSGHPMPFLRNELETRSAEGFPPAGELIAVSVRGAVPEADQQLREAVGAGVHGPAVGDDSTRWLVQGGNLREPKIRLRSVVQRWRDRGARVRIDVDPIDL